MRGTFFEIYLDGSLVDTCMLAGVAFLKYESAKLLGPASLRKIEQHPDPVLAGSYIYDDELGGWA